jgi:putative redox protein
METNRRRDALSEQTTKAHIVETGESAFAVSIEVSGHQLVGDEPVAKGGGDLGPAPYDLLLAALGECTAMTVRWYARQQNWPLERVEVTLTHAKGGVEGKSAKVDHFAKTIRVSGKDLTGEQRDKLIAVAARCPVQRTLEGTPVITTLAAS